MLEASRHLDLRVMILVRLEAEREEARIRCDFQVMYSSKKRGNDFQGHRESREIGKKMTRKKKHKRVEKGG